MSFSAFIVYTCAGPHGPPRATGATRDTVRGQRHPGPDVPPTCRPPRAACRPAPPPGGRGAGRPIRLSSVYALKVSSALLLSTIVRRGGRRESGSEHPRDRMRSAAKAGNVDAEPPPPSQIARPRPRVEPASHLSSTRHGDRHTRASTPTRWAMRLSQPVRTL